MGLHSTQDLFNEFQQATTNDWIAKASEELDGKNPMEALAWSVQGINGLPYYDIKTPTLGTQLSASSAGFYGYRAWYNMPVINVLQENKANQTALIHLQNGADGIVFDIRNHATVSLNLLLDEIEWRACVLSFSISENNTSLYDQLSEYLSTKSIPADQINGFVLSDTYPHHQQVLHKVIHSLKNFKNFHLLGINSSIETPVELLSDLLTKAVDTIERFKDLVPVEIVIRNIFFSLNVSTDFFIEIAKIKVLRFLWMQIVQAYEITPYTQEDLVIHVRSAAWSNEKFQPHENLLKSTTSTMAAILGGCTALSVEPTIEGDEHLQRISRNVSNLLREESFLNKVADPTAGSYYVDTLIKQLKEQSWKKFIENESKG